MKTHMLESIDKFFKMKNINVSLEYEYVSRYDYDSIVERLNSIIDKNPDCYFDLTGGKELVLVAMGQISAERKVPMIQYDFKNEGFIYVSNCEIMSQYNEGSFNVSECVSLHSGAVVEPDYIWDMNDDFLKDITSIWEVCRKNIPSWNKNSSALASVEKKIGEDDLKISFNLNDKNNFVPDTNILEALAERNIICDYRKNGNKIFFRFKNSQIKRCILKSGNALELLCYKLCREIIKEEKITGDARVGVMVDWDGVINEDVNAGRDTRNEIDVFLTNGHTPIFISCKNGSVSKEALYELQAVGDRFGGQYAKKILLTTYINRNNNARKFIIQRAKDMNIAIIEGIDKISIEEIKKKLALYIR